MRPHVFSRHELITLSIESLLGHYANAALIIDGRLMAASPEKRHTLLKPDGAFPSLAIAGAIAMAGLAHSDITKVVLAEKPIQGTSSTSPAAPATPSPAPGSPPPLPPL